MKYIGVDIKENNLYESQEATINYSRELLKNSNKLFIHYGTNGWENVNEIEMNKTPQGFEAKINIPGGVSEFNFAFRDENSKWDNNEDNNFTLDVKQNSEENEKEIKHFANDFLLKYTDNINETDITTNSKGLSEIELEKISFEHTKEELDKTIEEKFAKLFGRIETEESSKIEEIETFNEDEYTLVPLKFTSDIPYVKLFKEAKAEAMLSFEETQLKEIERPIVYTSNINLMNIMRMESKRKWAYAQAAKYENEEFALVRAFNPVEEYDNSLIGMFKKYLGSIVQSFKKLINIIKEDLNPASNEN